MKLTHRLGIYVGLGVMATGAILELPHASSYRQTMIVEHIDDATMVRDADVAVIGTVTKRLGTMRQADGNGEDMVYTRWLITPDRTIKGEAGTNLVVRTLGGRFLSTSVDVEDQPTFTVGERVMVYVERVPDWKNDYRVVGEFQGKFHLEERGGTEVAVRAETNEVKDVAQLEAVK